MMNGMEKSDSGIVAVKSANKGTAVPAEPMERRTEPEGDLESQSTRQTQDWESVSQAADRIRRFVQREPRGRLTTLLHHVTVDALRGSFFELKKNAAPGADGMTWGMYEEGLEGRLADLHDRVHSGAVNGTERCPVFGKIRCPIFCTLRDSNLGCYPEAALPSSSFTATLSIPALRLVLSR